MSKKKSFAIIGASNFSFSVVETLVSKRQQVTVFDLDKDRLDLFLSNYDTIADGVILDSTNKSVLEKNGINKFDGIVIGFGANIEASLMTTLNLIDLKCNNIIARARDLKHKRILNAIGLSDNQIIIPDHISGKIIGTRLVFDIAADIEVQSVDDDFVSSSLYVTQPSVINHTLDELNLTNNKDFNIIQIKRNGKVILPDPNTVLKEDDIIVIFAKTSIINELVDRIQGMGSFKEADYDELEV
jgi:trk system potassium uptake protein TrkA